MTCRSRPTGIKGNRGGEGKPLQLSQLKTAFPKETSLLG